ncbi:hypothetical protein [Acinetobacter dispersus]|uniref:hypothetical protein n=1 Tax=Acinetobacter dispersus TaxID=70348 RepID=UPI001BB125C7|nr:hypothetical protein [Acinetobacter dispersus]
MEQVKWPGTKWIGPQTENRERNVLKKVIYHCKHSVISLVLSACIGQVVKNPNQSVEMIKAQGMDFFNDQASAKLTQFTKVDSPIQYDVMDTFTKLKK